MVLPLGLMRPTWSLVWTHGTGPDPVHTFPLLPLSCLEFREATLELYWKTFGLDGMQKTLKSTGSIASCKKLWKPPRWRVEYGTPSSLTSERFCYVWMGGDSCRLQQLPLKLSSTRETWGGGGIQILHLLPEFSYWLGPKKGRFHRFIDS